MRIIELCYCIGRYFLEKVAELIFDIDCQKCKGCDDCRECVFNPYAAEFPDIKKKRRFRRDWQRVYEKFFWEVQEWAVQ